MPLCPQKTKITEIYCIPDKLYKEFAKVQEKIRCFKHYYKEYVCKHLEHLFPWHVSHNHFVELKKEILLQLTVFIKKVLPGTCTGISFVNFTPLSGPLYA